MSKIGYLLRCIMKSGATRSVLTLLILSSILLSSCGAKKAETDDTTVQTTAVNDTETEETAGQDTAKTETTKAETTEVETIEAETTEVETAKTVITETESEKEETTMSETEKIPDENIGRSGLKKNAVVVFTGDSITDGGRADRTNPNDLGYNNYVTMFNDYMQKNFSEDNIKVYNTGYSAYTIQNLHDNLKSFVYDLDPDYLIVNIGTNNAWFDNMNIQYVEKAYRSLIDDIQKNTTAKLILVQPYLYEGSFVLFDASVDSYIPRMAQISDFVCRVGAEKGIPVIYYSDILRQAMENMGYDYDSQLTVDGLHPSKMSYKMFYSVLCKELGIKGFLSVYKFDFSEIKAKYGVN